MKFRPFFPVLIVLAVILSLFSWHEFIYPRFSIIDLSITRNDALKIASDYLRNTEKADPSEFINAVVFTADTPGDRYLQKAIGYAGEEKFLRDHRHDFFAWMVRFMKEGQKEEYRIAISSKTGEIISMGHSLDDSASREAVTEEEAQKTAVEFFKKTFNFDFDNYVFNSKGIGKFDHRTEYSFTWERKDVYIKWSPKDADGGAKLVSSVKISGGDVLWFTKQNLSVPDQFNRDIERQKESSRNLGLFYSILASLYFVAAIWIFILRRNHLALNATKWFYIGVMICLLVLSIISGFNNSQAYVFDYSTTQPFKPFLWRQIVSEVLGRFFAIVCFLIPCFAGELLHFEVFQKRPKGGMFHYISTTFLSRDITKVVLLAYAFALIMIGFQGGIFEFGFRYLNVWVEQSRLNQLSSGYFPVITALMIGINASFTEESMYRLFGISFGVKVFKSLLIAVLVSSVVWGLGHTGYMVFPFWFRFLEVTLLGIFISFVYLRFGIICVVIVHYLFDVFWASSPYLFGKSDVFNFSMAVVILALPLIWGVAAFFINRPVKARKIDWRLTKQQQFNLEILKGFILKESERAGFESHEIRKQLIDNNWDVAVIDVAFKQLNIYVPGENHLSEA